MCQICRLHFFFDAAIIKQKDARRSGAQAEGGFPRERGAPFFPRRQGSLPQSRIMVYGGGTMRAFETNDWLLLNSMIYRIYTTEDFETMRQQFLEQLKMVIDFDSADFYLASQEGEGLCDPVTINCDPGLSAAYDELDYSRGIMYSGKTLIYRETDIISDEARVQTEYYQKVYRPNNWHFALQMVLARNKRFLGVVSLYRTIGKQDFQYEDIFVLDILKEHLAWRLSRSRNRDEQAGGKLSVSQAAERYELTRRETAILKLLLEGKDSAGICQEASISPNTLKKHISSIHHKMGTRSRVQLFKMVREME